MLKPLRDHILFRPFKRKDSEILIVINNKRMHKGEVVAIGKGRYERPERDALPRPLDVKVGDVVNVGETPLRFPVYEENGIVYWIIQESDIAFIEEVEAA